MKIDYLIVGQGLAGSLLAWRLLERKKRILVVDRDEAVTSSKVAAGLVTPLTGSQFKITPAFEERLLYARKFYWEAEESTGDRFFHHVPIAKLFRDEIESTAWQKIETGEGSPHHPYVAPLPEHPDLLHQNHGGFEMKGGGWLDVPRFLETTRQHLLERASYAIGRVRCEDVDTTGNGIRWKNVEASAVIFAEGWSATSNPWFDWLKMHNALGDILQVKIPALSQVQHIVNRGAWLLPLGGDRFKTGSNYRHRIEDATPDDEGRSEIAGKLETITSQPYEILEHQCAIRPIIKRSQVFCGIHPSENGVAFFNGLGSKGVVNGPWYADRMVAHLEDQLPLPPEADIRGNLV